MFKRGGFPPIRYCAASSNDLNTKKDPTKNPTKNPTKERFFSNAPRQNINIRQLLSDNKKIPIIITEDNADSDIEILETL
jgi:hypothetical protein